MERMVTAANGTQLAIDELGDPGAPLIVQLEGHQAQWVSVPDSYCRSLVEAGFRVVRMDNRDVGRSQRFAGIDYTLADMAADVHGLLQVLGSPAVVCGRSMGGAIAQLLAVHHPEAVLGLGLFYTFAKRTRSGALPPRTEPPFHTEDEFTRWQHRSLPPIAGPRYPYTPESLDHLAHTMWLRGVDWAGYDRQLQAMWRQPAWAEHLAAVDVPVAIVHGDLDPLIGVEEAHDLARLLPHARLHIVPGLGHQQPVALDDLFVTATLQAAGVATS